MVSPTPRKIFTEVQNNELRSGNFKTQGSRKHEHFYYQKPQKVFLTVFARLQAFSGEFRIS